MPNEKKSASSAISLAVKAARGISIMVPTIYCRSFVLDFPIRSIAGFVNKYYKPENFKSDNKYEKIAAIIAVMAFEQEKQKGTVEINNNTKKVSDWKRNRI